MRDEKAKVVIPGLPNNIRVSNQTYRFFYYVAHSLSCTFFTEAQGRDMWRQLPSPYILFVQNMEFDYPIIEDEDIVTWWRELPDDSILGFYDGLGRS